MDVECITLGQAKKLTLNKLDGLELSAFQVKFIASYISNNFNAKDAVLSAGYKSDNPSNVRSKASRAANNPKIRKGIRILLDEFLETHRNNLEFNLIDAYTHRAFYDPGVFYDSDGAIRKIGRIPKEWRVCLDGIEYKEFKSGRIVAIYKLANRDNALNQLKDILYKFSENREEDSPLSEDTRDMIKRVFDSRNKVIEFSA